MADARADDGPIKSLRQKTLKNSIHCSGISLHHGVRVAMTLHPAPADSGVRFRRADVADRSSMIRASWRSLKESTLCTTLANEDGVSVATVEHLLAALAGCGIDNLVVELHGPEVPIMDGSAGPFVFLIECAGTVEQDALKRGIRVLKRVEVGDERRSASLAPGPGFAVSVEIDYPSAAIACQRCSVRLAHETFKSDISRARTYGFVDDIDALRAAGLARGASPNNAIVIKGDQVLNEGGLRYRDEFVRHKVLDAIGDLYLAGGPLIGQFDGRRSGHRMTHRLLQALFADDGAWTYGPVEELDFLPIEALSPQPMAATA